MLKQRLVVAYESLRKKKKKKLMSFFIPDKDTDKLYIQFFRPKYQQI